MTKRILPKKDVSQLLDEKINAKREMAVLWTLMMKVNAVM